jgi:UDP-2,3-diacylglucosamine hydrolase
MAMPDSDLPTTAPGGGVPAASRVSDATAAFDAPVYVLADAHLGVAPAEQEALLWSFLDYVAGTESRVVMNGDMFEFWFEWGHVVPHVGVRLLAACAALAERGRPVLWIKGNHDCWGGDVLRAQSGAVYLDGPWLGTLAGWRVLVDHGDGLRPELDKGYRVLRALIRHRCSVRAFRWLHPDWGAAIARATSHTSRNVRPRDGGEGLRAVAHQALATDASLDAVIYGHTHIAMLERKSRASGIYANPGAWMNEPTFLKFTPESVSLCKWTGSAEEVQVSLERVAR